jgi:hypothetical protein
MTLTGTGKTNSVIHIDLNPADYLSGGSRALENRLNTVLTIVVSITGKKLLTKENIAMYNYTILYSTEGDKK